VVGAFADLKRLEPIVARMDPQPAGLGAAATGMEHRDRRVVGKQLGWSKQMRWEVAVQ
jgi:argininosuccinate lyase